LTHIIGTQPPFAGELKKRYDEGSFICYFERIGELHIWTHEELRAIIGT